MDIFFHPILLILILILPTYFLYLRKAVNTTKNPPPGSFGFPLVGETHQFFFKNPEIFLQERKTKYSSTFFKTNILGEPTVILSDPNGNKFLSLSEPKLVKVWYLKTQRKFFNILSQPPQQEAAKSNSTPIKILGFFKPEGLMKYMGNIESITQQHLITYWEGKNQLEIYPLLKLFVLSLVYQIYFGIDDPDRIARSAKTFDRLHAGIYSIPVNFPGTRYHRALMAAREIRKDVQFIMQEKIDALSRGLVTDDLLAQVIEAEKGGKYVPKLEVCNIIMGLMNASYTSLATTLTLMIKHIGERPDIYRKLVSEHADVAKSRSGASRGLDWESIQKMKYTWAVAQETMRLYPTAPGAFREAITDISYENFTIPKGWKIFWAMTATNKNPKYFPEPEIFDPSRFEGNGPAPFTFIPFGAGPRSCIGKDYARILVLTFIHHLIKKFKWEIIDPHQKIISDVILNIPSGLGIRFVEH